GNKEYSGETIRFVLGLTPGTVYNEERLHRGLVLLKNMYGTRGYINFTAVPQQYFNEEKKIVSLTVTVDEDRKFYVNRISFSGNTTTRDKVIRRELLVQEGQVFDSALWDRSLLKLNQLGYFDDLRPQDTEMKLNPADDTVDINVRIKERDKNKIGFNGGVSGAAGGFLGLNYSTNNFLGLGENMSINLEGGTRVSNYQFNFTEPYFLNQPIAMGFSAFSTRYNYNQSGLVYDQSRRGFSTSASRPLNTFQRLGLTYQF